MNHRCIAKAWQIEQADRLGAIVLPLDGMGRTQEYPQFGERFVIETTGGCYSESGWCFEASRSTLEEALEFVDKWKGSMRVCTTQGFVLYDPNYYVEGDRVFLAEEWWDNRITDAPDEDFSYFFKSDDPHLTHDWQPAETMPEKAARFWYEITSVKIKQAIALTSEELDKAGLGPREGASADEIFKSVEEAFSRLDAAYPNGDRWVIVLEVEKMA